MNNKKLALIILDGWGYGNKSESDAIYNAETPFFDSLLKKQPNATLRTDGEYVGLPKGQMGNSEVGHLNIGAGRVIYQDLVKINRAIQDGSLKNNPQLKEAIHYAKKNSSSLHLMGLVSDGGVHSHTDHLKALIEILEETDLDDIFIHAFTDGRDCDPHSGLSFIRILKDELEDKKTTIASVIGRYYAMDRDKRWERIKRAYDLLVHGEGKKTTDPAEAIHESYSSKVSDEFIEPIVCVDKNGDPIAKIKQNDVVICFNFRTDRCRQITRALTQEYFPDFQMEPLPLHYLTMTNYDETFESVHVVFEKENLKNTLGEVISNNGLQQIRIAETEKYPHVTFFFSGGREKEFPGEKRMMVASPKVSTYDLQPEMSAKKVTRTIVDEINKKSADFICLNFANPDMVGHTGVYEAIVKAVETVDKCAEEVVLSGVQNDYSFIIIADHGNADMVINDDQTPNTSHTINPVPIILIDNDYREIKGGKLADIAPTILKIMNIKIPKEMSGEVLVN